MSELDGQEGANKVGDSLADLFFLPIYHILSGALIQ